MKQNLLPGVVLIASLVFFGLGLTNPFMASKTILGFSREKLYLTDSIEYFFNNGDLFIGCLLLFFTLIFPILKYIFLGTQLFQIKIPMKKGVIIALEIINKWAMLDVFIVALIILNMKFDSLFINTELKVGTTFFAISIVLMMICSFILRRRIMESMNRAVIS